MIPESAPNRGSRGAHPKTKRRINQDPGNIISNRLIFLLVLLFYLFSADPASAGIYSYQNKDGTICITTRPPRGRKARLLVTTSKTPKGFKGPLDTGWRFDKLVDKTADTLKLSKPLLLAIIKTESNFNAKALSPKGACGLMQLMPATWKHLGVKDPFDPVENVKAGSAYFQQMLNEFKEVDLALAAYNAGPGAVKKHKGIPPYKETKAFVKKVRWYWDRYRNQKEPVKLSDQLRNFTNGLDSLNKGDLNLAQTRFRRVIDVFPESSEASFNLGLVNDRLGRPDQAVFYYRRAIRIDPYCTDAYHNLAIIYERIGQKSKAVNAWRQLLKYETRPGSAVQISKYIKELRIKNK